VEDFCVLSKRIITKQAIVRIRAETAEDALELADKTIEERGIKLETVDEQNYCEPVTGMTFVCSRCGSDQIEQPAWTNINTGALRDFDYEAEIWCGKCEMHRSGCCQVDALSKEKHCVFHNQPQAECREENGGELQGG
jgi:hypothetical protein